MSYSAARFAAALISSSAGGAVSEASFSVAAGAAASFDSRVVVPGEIAILAGSASPSFIGRTIQTIGGDVAVNSGATLSVESGVAPLSAVFDVGSGAQTGVFGTALVPSVFSLSLLPRARFLGEWAASIDSACNIQAGGHTNLISAKVSSGVATIQAGADELVDSAAISASSTSIQAAAFTYFTPDFYRASSFFERCGGRVLADGQPIGGVPVIEEFTIYAVKYDRSIATTGI